MDVLANLPTPLKFGAALLMGYGLIGAIGLVFQLPAMFYIILAVGMFFVALLLIVFTWFMGVLAKRKSAPLEQGLAGNAAAAPQGISEPARRARLDDLRRTFEGGVEKFRAAGKNLYSVPWYVVVGEPGSGKTEAIRHCNVGFPPGLQDQLQGAGGTLNMNWWFTNHAIILDTAGRLMFEEVQPGTTSEWAEFLKLLKGNRPNCPINGMLLVIPVDTLIKDTADSIERKATKIAQQFDNIQRALGVRFPVFVIITKCDLLNGFREFFDDLNDPQLQHQIMGWSNPAPLDERFNPEVVDKHLDTVKKRLTERRTRLLLDPVNTEDAQKRRTDQVDALYALPESVVKIAPRLRLYLEKIFVSGEWSPKPLFLRGIYFTSSMTEGSALDADLAEVLGIPVDALPEGRIWQRDRAFFLRDLFLQKVFREKGLVTRAGNAMRMQRRRKMVVLGTAFVAVLVMFLLTWLGSRALSQSIGQHQRFWNAAKDVDTETNRLIVAKAGRYEYHGNDPMPVDIGGKTPSLAGFYGRLDLVRDDIRIPFIFRPVAAFTGNVNTARRQAYSTLFEQTVIAPLVAGARGRVVTSTPENWSEDATTSLVQLLNVELANLKQPVDAPGFDTDAMLRYVLSAEDYKAIPAADREALQNASTWVYSANGGAAKFPPEAILQDPKKKDHVNQNLEVLKTGLANCVSHWQSQTRDDAPYIATILSVRDALSEYQAAEDGLMTLKAKAPEKYSTYQSFLTDWNARLAKLAAARQKAAAGLTKLETLSDGKEITLSGAYTGELERVATTAKKTYDLLLKHLPEKAGDKPVSLVLAEGRTKVLEAVSQLDKWQKGSDSAAIAKRLGELDALYMAKVKGPDDKEMRRFDVALAIYQLADAQLPRGAAATAPAPVALTAALEKVKGGVEAAGTSIDRVVQRTAKDDRLAASCEMGRFGLDVATRAWRYLLVSDALAKSPTSADGWGDYVASQSSNGKALIRPSVPLTVADEKFPTRFDPEVAAVVIGDHALMEKMLADKSDMAVLDRDTLAASLARVEPMFESYRNKYRNYWSSDVFDELKFGPANWADYAAKLKAASTKEVRIGAALGEYGAKARDALIKVGDAAKAAEIDTAMATLEDKGIKADAQSVIEAWQTLSEDPRAARAAILGLTLTKFRNNYTLTDFKPSAGFVGRYWSNFGIESLGILATTAQKGVIDGLAELQKYNVFPLAPLGDGKKILTDKDVALARAALQSVVGNIDGGPATAAAGAETLGDGAAIPDKELSKQIEALRGLNLLAGKEQYIARLKKVMRALPAEGRTAPVGISVLKTSATDAGDLYPYVELFQGDKSLGTANLRNKDDDKIARLELPGQVITFAFRSTQSGNTDFKAALDGPYAAIRLLHLGNGTRDTKDPRKWIVNTAFRDTANRVLKVQLQLEFERELPELADWPTARKN